MITGKHLAYPLMVVALARVSTGTARYRLGASPHRLEGLERLLPYPPGGASNPPQSAQPNVDPVLATSDGGDWQKEGT
ncbi:hypothetical protein ACFVIL_08885 [Streptomyces sp. NPDC127159]|uniref:hypothetical protein n=1 Tax=unclassified Streptomyces TaxID=2593676 RepID=UPI00362B7AFE